MCVHVYICVCVCKNVCMYTRNSCEQVTDMYHIILYVCIYVCLYVCMYTGNYRETVTDEPIICMCVYVKLLSPGFVPESMYV